MKDVMKDIIQARDDYVELIRREMLGPGSEISIPDEAHELISAPPDVRYSLGILFPCGLKLSNYDSSRHEASDEAADEAEDTADVTIDDADDKSKHGSGDSAGADAPTAEEDNLDEEINLASQNMPSSAGITFLANGDTTRISCEIEFATYHAAMPNECMVPFKTDQPDRVRVPASLCPYVSFDAVAQCFRALNGELTRKIVAQSKKTDASGEDEPRDVYNALFMLAEQIKNGYVRDPHSAEITLDFSCGDYVDGEDGGVDGIPIKLTGLRRRCRDNVWSITLMLVNNSREDHIRNKSKLKLGETHSCIFQPGLRIDTKKNDFTFCPFSGLEDLAMLDEEEKSLELQYRHKRSYANGLGAAAAWNVDADGKGYVETDFFPTHELPNLSFNQPVGSKIDANALHMKYLSDMDSSARSEKLSRLQTIIEAYSDWIHRVDACIDTLDDALKETARHNMKNCALARDRMKAGIETLATNDNAWAAFQLANRAMYMQRVHLKLQAKTADADRFPGDEELSKLLDRIEEGGYANADSIIEDNYAWRLFQIAFLLMSVNSIVFDNAEDRKLVDLIWFPTGGGKTEAYLGLTAFSIFFRRLQYPDACGGTSVMMRYTLRLLTAQQFTRASTLICACERIRFDAALRRPKYGRYSLGNERISIGLWIGNEHTPNKNEDAKKCLDNLSKAKAKDLPYANNKFQVLKCPWCGTKLVKGIRDGKLIGEWGYALKSGQHFYLRCPQERCFFNGEGSLPVQVVDEELYTNPPSLLFATVDKFAMLPWKPEIGAFFGIGNRKSKNRAPELIIQDELHLISGPLGTMVGLYETAIDKLCSEKGTTTKIVASTATIRRAREQCAALYDRDMAQFPPPGIDAEDSFFAREDVIDHENGHFGRLYIGMMPSGKTKDVSEVRIITALTQRLYTMDLSDDIKDKYWTLTGYFGSLRELGRCTTLVNDAIKDSIRRMAMRQGNLTHRRYIDSNELTSRVSTTRLNETLDKLEKVSYSKENIENNRYAANIVLATNMISVGIDIARLNTMLVVGQPKLTSEYIQASSRVGRKYPGVVITLYDGVRSRDRSHYEQFRAYHQAFYKQVEPTGATPFSKPARDRALHAILIGMMRILENSLRDEKNAGAFNRDTYAKRVDMIAEYILKRNADITRRLTPDADDESSQVEAEIHAVLDRWQGLAHGDDQALYYGERFMVKPPQKNEKRLMKVFNSRSFESERPFETMTSMRSVDGTIQGNVRIWED